MCDAVAIRPGRREDLARVAEIQAASSEAARWDVEDYLAHDFRVADRGGAVLGFCVARRVAEDESELLNLAVDPARRREGVATALLRDLAERHPGAVFLEVRAGNAAALSLYKNFSFQEVAVRAGYYQNPPEAAVVMCLRS